MNKSKLVSFINKYYLNGTVNSVVLNSNSNTKQLSTRFISGDKNLLGEVTMEDWDFETSEIGVYSTDQFINPDKLYKQALHKKIMMLYEALGWGEPTDATKTIERFF